VAGSAAVGERKRVVVTDHAFRTTKAERAVAEEHGAEFVEYAAVTAADALAAVRGANVVLVNLAPITAEAISGLAPEAVIIRYGVGYDNIDMDAARRTGVLVANVTDYGTDTVADHAATLLFTCLRRLTQFDRAVRTAGWAEPRAFGPMQSFGSRCVGLVGTGRIGLALAHRLRNFGFRLIAHDPYVDPASADQLGLEFVELPTLLANADAISLHLPLSRDTWHLVDTNFLKCMKPGAVLINTSRGALVDTVALATALADGTIAAAGLDVHESEPLTADSPLRALDNVILTPHVAFYSEQSMANLQQRAADELLRALERQPLKGRIA
jgi:D-3-phosphoglycerate dehydrogenase / 2-oxoglutarate reductase